MRKYPTFSPIYRVLLTASHRKILLDSIARARLLYDFGHGKFINASTPHMMDNKCSVCGSKPVVNVIANRDEMGKRIKFYCEVCDDARDYKNKKKWAKKNYAENKERFESYMKQWPGCKLSSVSHLFQQHSWATILKKIKFMKLVPQATATPQDWVFVNRENVRRWLEENERVLKKGVDLPLTQEWDTFHDVLWGSSDPA